VGADRREGRGRLSSIDLLPEEAEEDVVWALEQLRERKLPQNVILDEFNARLIEKDLEPVSRSAFNRYAVRKAIMFRKIDDVQRISGELVASLGTEGPDQVTVTVAEMVKVMAFQLLEDGDVGSKELKELSEAVRNAVSAQRGSEEYRQKLERRYSAKLEAAAAKAEQMAKEAGLGADRIAAIRKGVLGIGG
jgi:hypothetical protein